MFGPIFIDEARPRSPEEVLTSDTPDEQPPSDLFFIFQGFCDGSRKLNLKELLDVILKYKGVPVQAPQNNHRQDGKQKLDQVHRAWSQTCLHLLRIHLFNYQNIMKGVVSALVKQLQQQQFQLLAELCQKITNHRKEWPVPGSGTHDGTVDLFTNEDIKQAHELNRINQAGKGTLGKAKGKGMSLFGRRRPTHLTLPPTTTGGSWNFKKPGGFAMQGKGQGGQWFGQGALV